MRPATRLLPLIALALLAIAIGLVHGLETDRWRTSSELQSALQRLEAVPMDIGDWKGRDVPYEKEDFARAGIQGTIFREYHNPRTGTTVSVLLVCGRGGPISVHEPDVCYAGAGFRAVGAKERRKVEIQKGEEPLPAWALQFAKPDAVVPTRLEIYWGWFQNGKFEAPDQARFAYGRSPAVYKLYVVREFAANFKAPPPKENPCEQFLRRALPEFQTALAKGN